MKKITTCLASTVVLSGCITASGSFLYQPPPVHSVTNQITVNRKFEETWDKLVKNLSGDFFVINNIEKASRIINVSFSHTSPSQFVDCGQSSRTLIINNQTNDYHYSTASSSSFRMPLPNDKRFVMDVVRKTSLSGRSNIYVAPDGPTQTTVSVNTRYVVSGNVKQYLGQRMIGSNDFEWSLSTKQPFSDSLVQDGVLVECASTGDLERRILSYAE